MTVGKSYGGIVRARDRMAQGGASTGDGSSHRWAAGCCCDSAGEAATAALLLPASAAAAASAGSPAAPSAIGSSMMRATCSGCFCRHACAAAAHGEEQSGVAFWVGDTCVVHAPRATLSISPPPLPAPTGGRCQQSPGLATLRPRHAPAVPAACIAARAAGQNAVHRSTERRSAHLEGRKLGQAVHALVFVLAADEAAKGVHKHGAAGALLEVTCRAQRNARRADQVRECALAGSSQGLLASTQAKSLMCQKPGNQGSDSRHICSLAALWRLQGVHWCSGATHGSTRSPRQGQARACSIFFSMSCSPSACARASAMASMVPGALLRYKDSAAAAATATATKYASRASGFHDLFELTMTYS